MMFTELDEPEERRELRRSVSLFLRHPGAEHQTGPVRAADKARLRAMAGLGWTSLLIPEADGGLGLAHGDAAALYQELARAGRPEAHIESALLASYILARADTPLKDRLLPNVVSGEIVATLCWQGRSGALGGDDVGPRASHRDSSWLISGSGHFTPLVSEADALLVAARCENGVLIAWIGDRTGCQVEAGQTVDGSSIGTIHFNDVAIGEDAVLIGTDRGGPVLEAALDTARLVASAELLGTMEQAFVMTLDYLRQRQQFGRAIGSYQILQHRAVDLYIQIELARSALARAIAAFDEGKGEHARAAAVSAAKSRCSEAALLVVKQAVQLHGAIGYTEEYELSRFVRRALSLSVFLGNAASHRARYAATRGFGGGH